MKYLYKNNSLKILSLPIPVHFSSLIVKILMFTLAVLIHWPNIPGSYAILFFTASDFTSITSHIHNWALFFLCLCLFLLSGVISLLFSSSILDPNLSGEFIFQCPIFLAFHTVHGVLKERYFSCLLIWGYLIKYHIYYLNLILWTVIDI